MAEVIRIEPALPDLDAIADYIALDNPTAARDLVARVFSHVDQLESHPLGGLKLPEFRGWRYRQITEPPCRVIYRHARNLVHIAHVVRAEQWLDRRLVGRRGKSIPRK